MYLKIMKLLLFLYTLCLYIVNTLNLDLLRSIISKFDNFCVYLEKKSFCQIHGKNLQSIILLAAAMALLRNTGFMLDEIPKCGVLQNLPIIWNIL